MYISTVLGVTLNVAMSSFVLLIADCPAAALIVDCLPHGDGWLVHCFLTSEKASDQGIKINIYNRSYIWQDYVDVP